MDRVSGAVNLAEFNLDRHSLHRYLGDSANSQ